MDLSLIETLSLLPQDLQELNLEHLFLFYRMKYILNPFCCTVCTKAFLPIVLDMDIIVSYNLGLVSRSIIKGIYVI